MKFHFKMEPPKTPFLFLSLIIICYFAVHCELQVVEEVEWCKVKFENNTKYYKGIDPVLAFTYQEKQFRVIQTFLSLSQKYNNCKISIQHEDNEPAVVALKNLTNQEWSLKPKFRDESNFLVTRKISDDVIRDYEGKYTLKFADGEETHLFILFPEETNLLNQSMPTFYEDEFTLNVSDHRFSTCVRY